MHYEVVINGRTRRLDVAPDTPLLWALRDELGLTGTKYGCGLGICGACTVHLDGRPAPSCTIPMERLGRVAVTTIEGLSETGDHPVQRAWIEVDAPQCGYCHAGQIMAAAALLQRSSDPSDAEIDRAMTPVLCRCGTYGRIREAVRRAAGRPESR